MIWHPATDARQKMRRRAVRGWHSYGWPFFVGASPPDLAVAPLGHLKAKVRERSEPPGKLDLASIARLVATLQACSINFSS
jgi:hypothetical protein